MKKLILIIMTAMLSVAFAADQVGTEKGVVRQLGLSRWQVTKTGGEANTPWGTDGTTMTVAVATKPGILGRIFFVPGAATDTLTAYNVAAAGSITDATKIFETVPNSPTLINSPTNPLNLGQAVPIDFGPGVSFTTGLVIKITRAATTTAAKAYIMWDYAR